jgi:hypothetical protein
MQVLVTEPQLALAGTLLFLTGAPLFWLGRGVSRQGSRERELRPEGRDIHL